MLYHAGGHIVEGLFMLFELLIEIANSDLFLTENLLADIGNAKAAFFKVPLIAGLFYHLRIDKDLANAFFFFAFIVHIAAVDHEEAYGFIDLRGGYAHAFTFLH